jgi:hypothetical protein
MRTAPARRAPLTKPPEPQPDRALEERQQRLEQLPENADPEIRRKLLDIGQASDRARFEVSRNPLFALLALGRYRPDEELPLWVRRWLLELAANALRAALKPYQTPEDAAEQVRQALGVTRQGWNAIEELRRFLDDHTLAALHAQGVPARELAEAAGVEPRQIWQRAKRARARWPRVRKPRE